MKIIFVMQLFWDLWVKFTTKSEIFNLNIKFLRDFDSQNLFSFKVKLDQLGSGEDVKVKS